MILSLGGGDAPICKGGEEPKKGIGVVRFLYLHYPSILVSQYPSILVSKYPSILVS